jgi:hypothetical protein
MESKSHAWEILYRVVLGMIGPGDLTRRLGNAYIDGLHLLTPDRFPWADLQEPLRDILDYYQPQRPGEERLVIEGLPEDDQRRIALEIFRLFRKASERRHEDDKRPDR